MEDGRGLRGRRLPSFKAAALIAALGGVAVGLAWFIVGALTAQGHLRQRLGAHEARLARAISASRSLGGAVAQKIGPSGKPAWHWRLPSAAPRRERRARQYAGHSDNPNEWEESAADASAADLHAAHFTAAYVRSRHILHEETDATGRLTWNSSGLSELRQIYGTTRLTDSREWLVVPEEGLYFVYSQVTWWGRDATEMYLETTTNSLRNSIVLKVHNNRGSIELVAGMVTQSRDRCYGDCPLDSSYISGIFHLDEGAQIGVITDTKAAICTEADKTFVGIFMIRRCLEESMTRGE